MRLDVSRKSFLENLLIPVSKLADNVNIRVEDNSLLKTLVTTQDNSVVFLTRIPCKATTSSQYIIPECKSFIRLFSGIEEESISLDLDTNSINFNNGALSFKYHLLDESYVVNKKSISEEKIKSLVFDMNFSITKKTFSEIIKYQSILPDSTKLYFTTTDKQVFAKIGDETKDNTNELSLKVADTFQGSSITSTLPFDIQNLLLISFGEDNVNVYINFQHKLCKFETEFMTYILFGLVK